MQVTFLLEALSLDLAKRIPHGFTEGATEAPEGTNLRKRDQIEPEPMFLCTVTVTVPFQAFSFLVESGCG